MIADYCSPVYGTMGIVYVGGSRYIFVKPEASCLLHAKAGMCKHVFSTRKQEYHARGRAFPKVTYFFVDVWGLARRIEEGAIIGLGSDGCDKTGEEIFESHECH